jgi:predicted naringenin-chalcone synthase
MSYITAIETAVPDYKHEREQIISFFQNASTNEKIKRKIKAVANGSGIETRYSVLKDFSCDAKDFEFFPKNALLEPEPNLTQRMAIYKNNATKLSISAIKKIPNFQNIKKSITHIITVTCTGLFAPGLDIELMRELELEPSIQRSSINFMGCNAAVLALKNADAICKSSRNAKVLVVCTELCTIHFQKNYDNDAIRASSLFGDGSAAVLVESVKAEESLIITSFDSMVLHAGKNEMAWQLSEKGFIMNLTSYVSELINGEMPKLLKALDLNPADIHHWAIHPGGIRILDDFTSTLALNKAALTNSYAVLKNYGNMSSATLLFVLKLFLQDVSKTKQGETIFAAAFGPGLSIETMQLQYV